MIRPLLAATLLTLTPLAAMPTPAVAAQRAAPGIRGAEAPPWNVEHWRNLPDGATALNPADLEGKVIYLYCFQSWCPGCHAHGFPTLRRVIERYGGDDDVAFVAVQTAFEGFGTNTPEAAWRTGRRYDLTIPIGHDGGPSRRSGLMERYRSGGTPWTVIIDRAGRVRYDDFHVEPDEAVRLIDELRAQPAPAGKPVAIETLPASRGGQDLIGSKLPEPRFDGWARPQPIGSENPRLTLYRWWTDGCGFCAASLPAVERLRRTHGPRGLAVVAVYHPKPPREVGVDAVRDMARSLGYHGPIALDLDWSSLERAYDTRTRRTATSVSLLVDADGVIRFVHPGPVYFPSGKPTDATEDADYRLLERAIERLLAADDEPARDASDPGR